MTESNDVTQPRDPGTAIPIPRPIVKPMRRPFPLIWIIPVLAAIIAGYYLRDHLRNRGPEITIELADASGIRADQTPVNHRGVQIGTVSSLSLAPDQSRAIVHARLDQSATPFAKKGARYWVVRPEISVESVSGLGTVLSGPYIECTPGDGPATSDFIGRDKPPAPSSDGFRLTLRAEHLDRIQPDSPVYFRGVQVGTVRYVRLAPDATHVDIRLFIHKRYAPLVLTSSKFWALASADVKGGIFSGVDVKLGSLRTLISGGIAFATPDDPHPQHPKDGDEYLLHDEPQKDWLTWAPHIPITPDDDEPDFGTHPANASTPSLGGMK